MFASAARSPKVAALIVGAVIFLTAFAGLTQLDSREIPARIQKSPGSPIPRPNLEPVDPKVESVGSNLRAMWFDLHQPSIKPDAPAYNPWGAFQWELRNEAQFTRPMGENLCIIDLDNRPFDQPHQIFGPQLMSWNVNNASNIHGLSLGVLNHWLYAKVHGYKYYFIAIDKPEDRRASWKKAPVISRILKEHDTCIYVDSDAIFKNLDLPFEWLMNYWDIDPKSNSLALAIDPDRDYNKDKFGHLYLNTGFIIAQNNSKAFEILDAWQGCPESNSKHPECVEFRTNSPGKPTDQGGFGTFIRYDYADDIKALSCADANGYPGSDSECEGRFIRHLWSGKDSWIKVFVGQQIPGYFLELFHKEYLDEKHSFYMTEQQLMRNGPSQTRA